MAQQQLDLLYLAACRPTHFRAAMPNPGLCRIDTKEARLAVSWVTKAII
jgi:hypothetical protein